MSYCETSVIEYIRPLYASRKRGDGVFLAAKTCTDLPNQNNAWFIKWSVVDGGTTVLIEAIPYYGHGASYKKQYNYSDNTTVFNWTNGCMCTGAIGFTDNTGSVANSFVRKDIQTGRVDFHFECTNMDITKTALNTAFATIPAKYRPNRNITIMGICWETTNNAWLPTLIRITTNGSVIQIQSASYKITDIYFDAFWYTDFDDYTLLI